MNREKDELIPFQEVINVNLFFPGSQRRELLDEVKKAIADDVAVLSIIGDEGTGKTMLCRMVEKELSDSRICVYLPENLESFDEVVRILASKAGVVDIDQPQSIEETVSVIIENLKERDQHLVVIFDQAERLYLAMLERLRKLLDRMNTNENLLQLIFAGRKVLLENLDQLAICDFADAAETHFYLDYLDMAETYAYLNHCARQRSRAKGKSIFTPEAAKKIFNIARGNLRTTNILAAKSVESADDEGSFVITPRNVNIKGTGLEVLHESFLDGVRSRSGWLISGALLLLLIILLIAFFTGGDDNEQILKPRPERPQEISTETEQGAERLSSSSSSSAEQGNTGSEEESLSEQGINESSIVFTTETEDLGDQQKSKQLTTAKEEAKLLNQAEQVQSSSLHNPSGLNNVVSSKTVSPPQKDIEKAGTILQNNKMTGVGIDKAEIAQQPKPGDPNQKDSQVKVSGLSVKKQVDSTFLSQQTQEEKGGLNTPEQIKKQEKKIIVAAGNQSTPEQQEVSKVLVGTKKSVPNHLQSVAAPKQLFKVAKVKLPASGTAIIEKAQQQPSTSEGTLYEQRVAAGKALFSGKIEGAQTIQLMALTGDQAEKNLRELLSKKQYQQISDNIYILESKNSSTLYVYYGAFADKKSADQAREQLPPFLGKNEPYVISILEARSKVTP